MLAAARQLLQPTVVVPARGEGVGGWGGAVRGGGVLRGASVREGRGERGEGTHLLPTPHSLLPTPYSLRTTPYALLTCSLLPYSQLTH